MKLVQARLVTDDVEALATFYARLVEAQVALNEFYVEVPAGPATIGFSKRRFTEYGGSATAQAAGSHSQGELVLDFMVADVDAEYDRIAAFDVNWVMPPTTQPWGNRSMIFRDPDGNLVNVFSRPAASQH